MRERRRLLRGLLLVACFRARGLADFGGGRDQVLESLAPLLAFPLLLAVLALAQSLDPSELTGLLASVVAFLTPLIVSEALARRWGVESSWGQFAVAFNWCQWAVTGSVLAGLLVVAPFQAAGVAPGICLVLVGAMVIAYGCSLHWFLARRALGLSGRRSVLLVIATEVSTSLLVMGPLTLTSLLGAS